MKNFNFCQNKTRLNRAIESLDYYSNDAIENEENEDVMQEEVAWNSQLQLWLIELKSYWNKKPIEGSDFLCALDDGINKAFNIAYTTASEETAYTYLEVANWLTQLVMYRLLDSTPELQNTIGVTLRK